MDLIWLEDFLCLGTTLSFSRAAAIRNSTQPTFSRRIRALEDWVGAPLVDRSTVPVALTPEGRTFRKVAEEIVQSLHQERDNIADAGRSKRSFISFSMLANIAMSFFPDWLDSIEARTGRLKTRVVCANQHECVEQLREGRCDIYIAYFHESALIQLDPERFDHIRLAHDRLMPVSAPDADGAPLHHLDSEGPVALLDHPQQTFTAKLVEHRLMLNKGAPTFESRHENAMTAGLKAMAMRGRGLLWLPRRLATEELDAGTLVEAGGPQWSIPIEIRAYRRNVEERRDVERFWSAIQPLAA
ncbi:LysR substrate-binding domain-containing protein [Acuticoccus mangrovi]|uniref:LysR family transcriptional regulator n=1 Tax=Acuticoccus mangrovi TaxID=2796142 RepID=A0A934IMH1_9HYPH|nr:LysR substrate-binding domain-containing protein [Acuticoccus mangrovi]MBJ3776552.1 LysR family transcriptional regulator [Acuticoccus mangrovi]